MRNHKYIRCGRCLLLVALVAVGCRSEPPQSRVASSQAAHLRETLFRELQPLALQKCTLRRFGEPHDGGYLLCGNLLGDVGSAYSYGISGYDGWGCDVSRELAVPVHQYDCFDTGRTTCDGGTLLFHEECLAARGFAENGRLFDTLQQQIAGNSDTGKRLLVKMDVEGAEWDSLIWAPRAVLDQIDQLAIEFHGVEDSRFIVAVQRLKELFYVAHLHFNNYSCTPDVAPFPATAYEVLFVHKRLDRPRDAPSPARPHAVDAPNKRDGPDCQQVAAPPVAGPR